jgi:ubiquitin-protein ligase
MAARGLCENVTSSKTAIGQMTNARRRLMIDLKNLRKDQFDELDASPDPNSILKWHAKIRGPKGSQWEGQMLAVDLDVPESYPMDPPKATFTSKVLHPNV